MSQCETTKLLNSRQQTGDYRWVWVPLVVVILLTSAIRIRLLDVPLERDEGEYAYTGQLILQGIAPYEKAYNMKMPGIYAAYALILAIFGQTHTGIHLGLLFINVATIVLVFLLARDLFDSAVGLFAGAAYALLSVGQGVQGVFANAEHFILPPALAGILLLRKAVCLQKHFLFFLAGLLLGLAFIMKQHGAAFIIFAGLYLLISERDYQPINWKLFSKKGLLFSMGVFSPFILMCLILWGCGVFKRFWFWTFDYAKHYVSMVPFEVGLFGFKLAISSIVPPAIGLWALAGIGLFCLFWNCRFRKKSLFVAAFLIFSFLSVCPGLYFRPHYFILFLPAVSLLIGVGVVSIYQIFSRCGSVFMAKAIPSILIFVVLSSTLYQQWNYLFAADSTGVCRSIYGLHPFPESLEIAKFIRQNSQKTDTIAVIGSEPQIYFYSQRPSATGYIYTFPLMEVQPYASKMQEEMIMQIEQASPKFLIFVHMGVSWMVQKESDQEIFDWFEQYSSKYYHTVGIVDLIAPDFTLYRWGTEAADYSPQSDYGLLILRHNRYGDPNNILVPEPQLK